MISISLFFFNIIFGIIVVFIGIKNLNEYIDCNKRRIFAIILSLVSIYYTLFATIQINENEKLIIFLHKISFISLIIASSIGLTFLLELLKGQKSYYYFQRYTYISIIFSIIISLILLISNNLSIKIYFNGYYYYYKFEKDSYSMVLFFYFLVLFLGHFICLISLLIIKSKIFIKIYTIYSAIYLLPFIYFFNYNPPYLVFIIQNISIFCWIISIYYFLKNYQSEIINYYNFQIEAIEGISSLQFLLNKDFYIIDTTDKSASILGYKRNDLIGKPIDNIIQDFNYKSLINKISKAENYSEIYKLKGLNNKELVAQLFFIKIPTTPASPNGFWRGP